MLVFQPIVLIYTYAPIGRHVALYEWLNTKDIA